MAKPWEAFQPPQQQPGSTIQGPWTSYQPQPDESQPAPAAAPASSSQDQDSVFNFPYGTMRALTPDIHTPGRFMTGWNDAMSEGWGDEANANIYSHLPTWMGGDSYANVVNAQRKKLAESGLAGGVGQAVGSVMQPLNYLLKPTASGALYGAGAADPDPNADATSQVVQRGLGAGEGAAIGAATGWAAPWLIKGGMKVLPKRPLTAAEQAVLAQKQRQIDIMDVQAANPHTGVVDDPAAVQARARQVVSGKQNYWTPEEWQHWKDMASGHGPLSAHAMSYMLDPNRSPVLSETTAGLATGVPQGMLAYAIPGLRETVMSNPMLASLYPVLSGATWLGIRRGVQNAGTRATQAIENAPINALNKLRTGITGNQPLPLTSIPGIIQMLKSQAIPIAAGQTATSQIIPNSPLPYGAQ
jgi:hypothetical protein